MLETLARLGVDVVIRHAPATDAIKRVDRKVLEQALRSVDGTKLINPTLLVTANGGPFDVYES